VRNLKDRQSKPAPTDVEIGFEFKSTTRTQKLFIESAHAQIGNIEYNIKRKLSKYTVENVSAAKTAVCGMRSGFTFEDRDFFSLRDTNARFEFWPLVTGQRAMNDLLKKTY